MAPPPIFFLPRLESLLCFVSLSMPLEQRIEPPAGLGQGGRSMVEEEEKNGEERVEVN